MHRHASFLSGFCRTYLLLALSLASLCPVAMADTVTVVEGVKILNNNRAEAVFYYQNNWAQFRRDAELQDAISSYELIIASPGSDETVDILLITRFDDADQYAGIEDAYEKIAGGRDLQLLNDVKPGDFRQNLFSIIQGDALTPD